MRNVTKLTGTAGQLTDEGREARQSEAYGLVRSVESAERIMRLLRSKPSFSELNDQKGEYSIGTIANAVGFSMALKGVNLSLWQWISENCEEFREMQIVRHAKYVGTMIGPDGHIHRWSAPRKIHPSRVENQCAYQELG